MKSGNFFIFVRSLLTGFLLLGFASAAPSAPTGLTFTDNVSSIYDEGDFIVSWVSGGSKDQNGNPRKQSGTKIRDSERRSKTFGGIAKAMAEQWGGL